MYVHTVQSDHCPKRRGSSCQTYQTGEAQKDIELTPGNLSETIKQSEIKRYLHLVRPLYHNRRTAIILN